MMKGLGKAMKFCLNSSATSVCLQTGWLFPLTLVETWKRGKRETKSEWMLWSLGNQASCTWKEQGPHGDLKIEAQKMLLMGSPGEKVLAWHTYMAYLDRWIYNWFSVLFALHWCGIPLCRKGRWLWEMQVGFPKLRMKHETQIDFTEELQELAKRERASSEAFQEQEMIQNSGMDRWWPRAEVPTSNLLLSSYLGLRKWFLHCSPSKFTVWVWVNIHGDILWRYSHGNSRFIIFIRIRFDKNLHFIISKG